ncbi:DUF6707 family protein [Capnocytophaga canimorsus]|uniref:DUF6707 family protein n=1 Tax=Capnocytophaga canimorsus TaxID=28188 RepID=UPI00384F5048
MNNILEKIESKFENQKPYDLVIEATKVNLELPSFLRKLCKSAYIAHLQGNIEFCEEILSLIIDIPFVGGESKGVFKPHAEKAVWNSLQEIGILPEQITKIYSELKPCMSPGRYCSNFINKTFPNAEVSYTFEYLNVHAMKQ